VATAAENVTAASLKPARTSLCAYISILVTAKVT
jgi:hypothetical protein